MVKLSEIIAAFERFAPPSIQESYDNSGIQVGSFDTPVNKALLCIDIVEQTIDEAIKLGCNLIISHHPLIFKGLKSLTGKDYIERCLIKAIKNDIAIYSCHTNIDIANGGVNDKICKKLKLQDCKVLQPRANELVKLVTFIPHLHEEGVKDAIFNAGAGSIGNYDCCSFKVNGIGSFRANSSASPFVGDTESMHSEKEVRLEVILPKYVQHKVVSALIDAHPYEEVAYDIYPLENTHENLGIGRIGELPDALNEEDFISLLKETFKVPMVRFVSGKDKPIKKVALCGGSGAFLLKDALNNNADAMVSADFKYHDFFVPENKMLIADIGHYESEQYTVEVFNEILTKNFPTFANHYSQVNSNPLKYR